MSAADVLTTLSVELCEKEKVFDHIYVLFDEFGRYIEYAAENPLVAGDSALQQVFEAIQNSKGNIIFDAFIQSELNAYLSRIEQSSNIIRYIGRYENSVKYHLSANFETILANLIVKSDSELFSRVIEENVGVKYKNYHDRVFSNINRWNKSAANRGVWSNSLLYNSVIVKGCYPLHPLTVWFLSNTSEWMQQRSTIAFAERMFENIMNEDVDASWLPYVYAIDIVDSDIFAEMCNSEEKGLVNSENCLLYRSIMTKYRDKLNENDIKVLKAILIINICRFSLYDQPDCFSAISLCANLKKEDIEKVIARLENELGIISFDENTHRYDLISEAHGRNDYKRLLMRKLFGYNNFNGMKYYDEELFRKLGFDEVVQTSFAKKKIFRLQSGFMVKSWFVLMILMMGLLAI